jgi:hypothetical protein
MKQKYNNVDMQHEKFLLHHFESPCPPSCSRWTGKSGGWDTWQRARIYEVLYYYLTAMILTVGALSVTCPVREATCPFY